jgi:SAM-dependent methyltransferase
VRHRQTRFFSTFPAGLDQAIAHIVRADYPDAQAVRLLDNAMVYQADLSNPVLTAPYFQNTFRIIDECECGLNDNVERLAAHFGENLGSYGLDSLMRRHRSFRLVFSRNGRLVQVQDMIRRELESRVAACSARPCRRRGADVEMWIALRREPLGLFLFRERLTQTGPHDRPQGMLAPQLAAAMCRLTEPSDDDILIDPFCGYGGVFLQRLNWPYRMAFAVDQDPACIHHIKRQLDQTRTNWRKRTYVRTGDGSLLADFDAGFFSTIVTDPPWGDYDRTVNDVDSFYDSLLRAFARVVRPSGRIVMLVGRMIGLQGLVARQSSPLVIQESHDLLVSGKKATLYKLDRR